ncbi:MAG: hypothetical protein LCH54_00990 [Bacteroidetes bacterium]|nr:hypothetical protein [Bacteroidota bacterium]
MKKYFYNSLLLFILFASVVSAQQQSEVFFFQNGDSLEELRLKGKSSEKWLVQKRDGSVVEIDSTSIVRIRPRNLSKPETKKEQVSVKIDSLKVQKQPENKFWTRLKSGQIGYFLELGAGHPFEEKQEFYGFQEKVPNLKLGFNVSGTVRYDFLPWQHLEFSTVYMYHFSQYQKYGASNYQTGDPWHFLWLLAGPRLRPTMGSFVGIEVEAKAGFLYVSRPERIERSGYFMGFSNITYESASVWVPGSKIGVSLYVGEHFALSGQVYFASPEFNQKVTYDDPTLLPGEKDVKEEITLPVISIQYRF